MAATGRKASGVSGELFGDGKIVGRLRAGRNITVHRLADAHKRMDALEREAMSARRPPEQKHRPAACRRTVMRSALNNRRRSSELP